MKSIQKCLDKCLFCVYLHELCIIEKNFEALKDINLCKADNLWKNVADFLAVHGTMLRRDVA